MSFVFFQEAWLLYERARRFEFPAGARAAERHRERERQREREKERQRETERDREKERKRDVVLYNGAGLAVSGACSLSCGHTRSHETRKNAWEAVESFLVI